MWDMWRNSERLKAIWMRAIWIKAIWWRRKCIMAIWRSRSWMKSISDCISNCPSNELFDLSPIVIVFIVIVFRNPPLKPVKSLVGPPYSIRKSNRGVGLIGHPAIELLKPCVNRRWCLNAMIVMLKLLKPSVQCL